MNASATSGAAGSPKELSARITTLAEGGPERRLMEVCGTHTVSLFRSGVRSMLPPEVRLISGPGCPVCVTASGYLDAAVTLAERGITICTYGDMVRVPGTGASLGEARARGATVKVVYTPREALRHALEHPDEQVVFLAVGFETTTPATALTLLEAERASVDNFSVLVAHKLVVPALLALLSADEVPLDGFICPGHVSVIIGSEAYRPVVERGKPCVVAGFEPPSMLASIARLLELLTADRAELDNAYGAVVRADGNAQARAMVDRVFTTADASWRALGTIPESGLLLCESFARFDAATRFEVEDRLDEDTHPPGCRCGEVIQGKVEPQDCDLFGTGCSPARPIGPCMVSSEGTCAAWYKYGDRL
ncbi:MAG: hydrogenase formation protein HypD [Proteobacteria bacterium]|nr:MAG: hydrogenase formation protein HypD [Pseudomonadota bacterium]